LGSFFESTNAHLFVAAFSANQDQIQGLALKFFAPFQTPPNLETKSIKTTVAEEYSIAEVSMDGKMHHIALSTISSSGN
jgi:hypothetical protein